MMIDGLRAELSDSPVGLTGIYPGFIDTDMIKGNAFNMPDVMPVAKAATIIADGLAQKRDEILFPEETADLVTQVMTMPVEDRIVAVRSLMRADSKNL